LKLAQETDEDLIFNDGSDRSDEEGEKEKDPISLMKLKPRRLRSGVALPYAEDSEVKRATKDKTVQKEWVMKKREKDREKTRRSNRRSTRLPALWQLPREIQSSSTRIAVVRTKLTLGRGI
jgi:hypothetical protein